MNIDAAPNVERRPSVRDAITSGRHRTISVSRRSEVGDVLRHFDSAVDDGDWDVELLFTGGQAASYRVRTRDRRRLYQDRTSLVVKLYKCRPYDKDVIDEECQSLSLLGAALQDMTVAGWRVTCPTLVSRCDNPPALVLTEVGGTRLEDYLVAAPDVSRDFLDGVAEALFRALEAFWARAARPYGDAHLENVLCDTEHRVLSLLDPGSPKALFECASVSADHYPVSRDLAYLLYNMALMNVQRPWQRRSASRRVRLMQRMLGAYLGRAGLNGSAESFWREVEACIRVHVDSMRGSWFPKSVWQRYLRFKTPRSVLSFCSTLKAR